MAADVRATKPRSGTVRPDVDLRRQRGRCLEDAVWRAGDEGVHADQQQRRGFAERLGETDDRAGHDRRHGERQDVVEDRLMLRRADAERRLADRRRHRRQRRARDDDDRRQGHQCEHHAADQRRRARQAEPAEKDRKAEQTEHDRRHGSQIVDVDLDQVGEAVLRRELLEIDRGADTDRQADQQADEQQPERT